MKQSTLQLSALSAGLCLLSTASLAGATLVLDASTLGGSAYHEAYTRDNGFNGSGNGAVIGPFGTTSIGDVSSGGGQVRKVHLSFELPALGEGEELESAVLSVFLFDKVNTATLNPVSVFHSQGDNDSTTVSSDYHNAAYVDSGSDLFDNGSIAGQYYEVDVTALVQSDFLNDSSSVVSSFRLEMDGALGFGDDAVDNQFVIRGSSTENFPQLVLETTAAIPEPKYCGLLTALSLVSLRIIGRRRSLR